MKKILVMAAILAGVLSVICVQAYAQVGDITDTIYTTDILTQVDGRDIKSYAIDGETMIALEDLEDYGFTVYYNDNIRTVFVTKTGTVDESFNPAVSRGTVGGTDGYVYETDIKAFLNGEQIDAYAIDGKMVAKVEEMGAVTDFGSFVRTEYKSNQYMMGYTYDDEKRLLSLDTEISNYGSYKDEADFYLGTFTPWGAGCYTNIHNENAWLIEKVLGGLPHGDRAWYKKMMYSSGLVYNIGGVVEAYGLDFSGPVFSEDGKRLYFKNFYDDGASYDCKQMELYSLHIYPLDEAEYNRAATHVTESGMNAFINITDEIIADLDSVFSELNLPDASADGISAPIYSVGGRDFVRLEDLNNSGFLVSQDKTSKLLTVINMPELKNKRVNTAVKTGGYGSYVNENECIPIINGNVFHNGFNYNSDIVFMYNGDYYLAVSALALDYYGSPKPEASYLNQCTTMFIAYDVYDNYVGINGVKIKTDDSFEYYGYNRSIDISNLTKTIDIGNGEVRVYCDEYEYIGNSVPETGYSNQVLVITGNGLITDAALYIIDYIIADGDVYDVDAGKWHVDYDERGNDLIIKLDQNNNTYLFDLDTYTVSKK